MSISIVTSLMNHAGDVTAVLRNGWRLHRSWYIVTVSMMTLS